MSLNYHHVPKIWAPKFILIPLELFILKPLKFFDRRGACGTNLLSVFLKEGAGGKKNRFLKGRSWTQKKSRN